MLPVVKILKYSNDAEQAVEDPKMDESYHDTPRIMTHPLAGATDEDPARLALG
jgi:hypothetical protein